MTRCHANGYIAMAWLRALLCAGIALMAMAGADALFAQDAKMMRSSVTSPETRAEANSVVQMLTHPSSAPSFDERNPHYTLRASDVVEIDFLLAPTYNQVQSVQPDGYIALQNLGELYVAGKTIPELIDALKIKYSKIMRDPQITVVLKDFERPYFIASGQVGKPGKYDLRGVTTVTQAVAIAGGLSDVAKGSRVLLFRRVSNDYVKVKQLDLKKMFGNGDLREDVELRPGDLLFVPKSMTASVLKSLFPHTSAGLYFPLRGY